MHYQFAYILGHDTGDNTMYGLDQSNNWMMYNTKKKYKMVYISEAYWNSVKDDANIAGLHSYNRNDLYITRAAAQFTIDSVNYASKYFCIRLKIQTLINTVNSRYIELSRDHQQICLRHQEFDLSSKVILCKLIRIGTDCFVREFDLSSILDIEDIEIRLYITEIKAPLSYHQNTIANN